MKVFIDQSGKIEQTNTPTVVAYANGKHGTVLLSAKDKQILQKYYRSINRPTIFAIQIFSILIFLLIKRFFLNKNVINIDEEYVGYNSLIKNYISFLCIKEKIDRRLLHLRFTHVGKNCKAHSVAQISHRKKSADFKIHYEEVMRLTAKLEVL